MSRSKFGIELNYELSNSSYLYNNNDKKTYLDFFGMFSSLPLGYNHSTFEGDFEKEVLSVSKIKTSNKAFDTDVFTRFDKEFKKLTPDFDSTHYTSTGALAVEAACKCAYYHSPNKHKILTFKKSFHGIYGFTTFLTDRFSATEPRLNYLPGLLSMGKCTIEELTREFLFDNVGIADSMIPDVAAILVEPIKCTYGDEYWTEKDFLVMRKLADELNIPLIFDEIQVGFGATGTMWYYEQLGVKPDILVYGKRTQISGIATTKKYEMPNMSDTLSCTWDGDVVDMLRCIYIMQAYEKYNILDNVNDISDIIYDKLKDNNKFNFERSGLIMSAKFNTTEERDKFYNYLLNNDILSNSTGEYCIRFRPSLSITEEEVNTFLNIVNEY